MHREAISSNDAQYSYSQKTALDTSRTYNRFCTWKDLVITPGTELVIVLLTAACISFIGRFLTLGIADCVVLFLVIQAIWALVILKIIRTLFPFKEGIFRSPTNDFELYIWKLQGLLCTTNLAFQMLNSTIPPVFRKPFYQLLGAKIASGVMMIGGRIMEPSLVTIESNAIVGDEVLLLPHALTVGSSEVLILKRIVIESGAIIGARSLIMPGVTIGENAMIKAMSLVTMNTHVPKGEIWAGIPARKMGEVANTD